MLQITLDNRVGKCDFEPHSVLQREMLVYDSREILFYLVLFIFLGLFILRKREWERGRKRGRENPDAGLNLTTVWWGPELKSRVWRLTRWATQALLMRILIWGPWVVLLTEDCGFDGSWVSLLPLFSSYLTTFLGAVGSFLQLRETLFALKIQDWNRSERWGSWRTWKLWCSYQICVLGKSWWHWLDTSVQVASVELEGPDARSPTGWALHVEGNDHPYFPPPAFWGGWRGHKNREVHNFLIYVFLSLKPLKQPSITLIVRIKVVTNSILLFL